MRTKLLPILALALLAPAAQALYIETPLHLSPTDAEANVGDGVRFDVSPANESAAAAYAGRTLRVQYTAEAETPEETVTGDAGTVTLDDEALGAFTWTVPQEADDRNVRITLLDGEEAVAFANVRVGDAAPIMYATEVGQPAGGEVVQDAPESESQNATPGFTALAIVGGAAVAVLALSRRRA